MCYLVLIGWFVRKKNVPYVVATFFFSPRTEMSGVRRSPAETVPGGIDFFAGTRPLGL